MIRKFSSKILSGLRTKFGPKKPVALTIDGWRDFENHYRKDKPVTYFFLESIPNKIGEVYYFLIEKRIQSFKEFVLFRFTERTHLINTGLGYGYHEVDDRMFYGMFELLRDYVEGELAWLEFVCMGDHHPFYDELKKERFKSKYLDLFGIHQSHFKSKKLGLYHLTYTLEENPYNSHSKAEQNAILKQQETNRTILELYLWYTQERPNRKKDNVAHEAYEEIPNKKQFEKDYGGLFLFSDEFKKNHPTVYNNYANKIINNEDLREKFYEEDTMMLKKLVDIRSSLWT